MTDLERRALLGDAEAQRECTEKGIVLACPFCGRKDVLTLHENGKIYHNYITDCVLSGRFINIDNWNARPAPPIGRCWECAYWDKNTGECADAADTEVAYHKYTDPDFFCGEFKPKGGGQNE